MFTEPPPHVEQLFTTPRCLTKAQHPQGSCGRSHHLSTFAQHVYLILEKHTHFSFNHDNPFQVVEQGLVCEQPRSGVICTTLSKCLCTSSSFHSHWTKAPVSGSSDEPCSFPTQTSRSLGFQDQLWRMSQWTRIKMSRWRAINDCGQ